MYITFTCIYLVYKKLYIYSSYDLGILCQISRGVASKIVCEAQVFCNSIKMSIVLDVIQQVVLQKAYDLTCEAAILALRKCGKVSRCNIFKIIFISQWLISI